MSEYTLNHGELHELRRTATPRIRPNSLEEAEALAAIDAARYEEEREQHERRRRQHRAALRRGW